MAEVKEELKYTKDHEWILQTDNLVKIGISDYAQENLGDIVFVEMPEVGDEISQGDSVATIESVKAVSDVYAPVSGKVIEVNDEIANSPEIINKEPYEGGWICVIDTQNSSAPQELMNSKQYEEYLQTLE
ncbi:MAG: glycine cleavage system protein GcvH [Spirochaetia bacterium]|nr:glycine cleavage system protein GcvH [Spirochaetia bacterium]